MSLVEFLMNTAVADSQLLVTNQEVGDRADVPRDIDFRFYAKEEERANLVASFVTDYRYGKASVEPVEHHGVKGWQLLIRIHAPTTEHVLMSLSGFMVCLSQLYELDYDGWESDIMR